MHTDTRMAGKIIIIVSHPYGQDGQLQKEARTLRENGFAVKVIAWDRRGSTAPCEVADGVEIYNIHIKGEYGIGGGAHVLKTLRFWGKVAVMLLRERGTFAIHCQDLNTLPPGLIAGRMRRRPVIFDSHDPYPELIGVIERRAVITILAVMEKVLCRYVDAIITVNDLMCARFKRFTHKPIYALYNYPELDLFTPLPKERGKKERTVVIGRIGTVRREVGIEETIEAFQKLPLSNTKLLLIGRVTELTDDELQRMIAPVRERVELIGEIDFCEVPDYYQRLDISIMLYKPSGMFHFISPMKLFESMAMAVPVIASDVGETRQFVEGSNCGVVVDALNREEIVAAMHMLVKDAQMRATMGANGRRAILETYNWERESAKLIDIYKRFAFH